MYLYRYGICLCTSIVKVSLSLRLSIITAVLCASVLVLNLPVFQHGYGISLGISITKVYVSL